MTRSSLLPALAVLLLTGACDNSDVRSVPPLPEGAVLVGPEVLVTDHLASVADLGVGDQLYRLPVADNRAVLVRVRPGQPTLLFGTSRAVVSGVELPQGWDAVCLEFSAAGQRHIGRFPYGVVGGSDGAFAGATSVGAATDPGAAALDQATVEHPELVNPAVSFLVVLFSHDGLIDTRVRVEAEDYCHWYGAGGYVVNGRMTWNADEALPCGG